MVAVVVAVAVAVVVGVVVVVAVAVVVGVVVVVAVAVGVGVAVAVAMTKQETELGLSLYASPDGRPGGVAVYARNANTIFFDKDSALALIRYFAEFYGLRIDVEEREKDRGWDE